VWRKIIQKCIQMTIFFWVVKLCSLSGWSHEDGDSILLRNVYLHMSLQGITSSHPWEPQISHNLHTNNGYLLLLRFHDSLTMTQSGNHASWWAEHVASSNI
jgi:hypothetical protein